MTGLSTLKLVSSQPVRKSSPREIRRQKLCKKLLEQLEMARCIKAGGSYEVIVTKRVRDEETGVARAGKLVTAASAKPLDKTSRRFT